METRKIHYFENKPCKFILRNGRTVFGIVAHKIKQGGLKQYIFSTTAEYYKRLKNHEPIDGMPIDLQDLVYAEIIND
jgi:hypothetical protein